MEKKAKKEILLNYLVYTPSSEFLESLKLKNGKNQLELSVNYLWKFTNTIVIDIYLYDNNTKFIVSDIDGTITKSDVLGVVLPFIGMDWTQKDVSRMLTNISNNGYQIIYLSAKTFVAQNSVKNYLSNVNQSGFKLPSGPVIDYPKGVIDDIMMSIREGPTNYKSHFMQNIQSMFTQKSIIAGFGNAPTVLL